MLLNTARRLAAAAALVIVVTPVAHAQTATQTVTFAVNAVNQLSFAGTPTLTIITAVAGSAPTAVTDATSTWAVTTNQSGAKVTASIASAMPAGLTLSASLAAPTGATSAGFTALGVAAVDVVTGITKLAQGSLALSYKLDATAAAGVVTSASRIVTYTITGGT